MALLINFLLLTTVSFGGKRQRKRPASTWAPGSSSNTPSPTLSDEELCGCYNIDLICSPITNNYGEICYYYQIEKIADDDFCKPIEYLSLGTGDLDECGLTSTDIKSTLLDYAPKCYDIDPLYDGTCNDGEMGVPGIKVKMSSKQDDKLDDYMVFSVCFDASKVSGIQQAGKVGIKTKAARYTCDAYGILPKFCDSTTTNSPIAPAPLTPAPITPSPVTPVPVTPAPVTPNPTTPAPITPSPTTASPVTASPTTPSPTTPSPVTPSPTTPAPVTPSPTTPSPTTPSPTTPSPTTPAPVTPAPVTPAPVTPAPVTPSPTTPSPTTPSPVTPTPTTPAPVTPSPTTPSPTTPSPTTPAPVTPAPVTPSPTTPAPPTPAPVTPLPTTPSPTTPSPTTPAPITPSPTTPAPVTPSPVTPAPVTPAPITPRPTTPAPVTPSPTTPRPTSNPTTTSPTTAQPSIAPTFVECTSDDELNIAFLLDESGSVDQSEWGIITRFVERIVTFDVSPLSYVALYEYASLASYQELLSFTGPKQDATAEQAIIDELQSNVYNPSGQTETWDAVNRVLDDIHAYKTIDNCDGNSDSCWQRNDILFLVTDGEPTGTPVCGDMATRMMQSDVDIVIILIDPNGVIDETKVSCLDAQNNGADVIRLPSFDSDAFNAIEARIRAKICSGNNPSSNGAQPAYNPWTYCDQDGENCSVGLGPIPTRSGGGQGGAADPVKLNNNRMNVNELLNENEDEVNDNKNIMSWIYIIIAVLIAFVGLVCGLLLFKCLVCDKVNVESNEENESINII